MSATHNYKYINDAKKLIMRKMMGEIIYDYNLF